MKSFTLGEFVEHLARVAVAEKLAEQTALEVIGKVIEKEAKAEIGTYQDEAGEFVAWAELADSTKADRLAQGYSENEPLLRDGTLRDSIQHTVVGSTAYIGSDSEVAVWQELGTAKIPPRSFLGGAAVRREKDAHRIAGQAIVLALTGEQVFERSLTINTED